MEEETKQRRDSPSNSVLEVKLDYIQKDIAVIKSDVKEIKSDYVTRREFENNLRDLAAKTTLIAQELDTKTDTRFKVAEERIDKIYTVLYWFLGLLGAATFASFSQYIFK